MRGQARNPRPQAPARWRGWQERPSGRPAVELWNLTHDIPGHPAGSTVTRETIEGAGYDLPEPPEPRPNPAGPRALYDHEKLAPAGEFDPRSFRTVKRGSHRVRVGCPSGKYSAKRRRCRTAMRAQGILHPNPDPRAMIRAGEYVAQLRGQANRAFATAYLDHLVHAQPQAPDFRAFHVASDDAVKIRRDLAQLVGAPYPNPEDEDFDQDAAEDFDQEPGEDDYTITPTGPLGSLEGVAQGGKFLGTFSSRGAAERFIRDRMAREQFFPSVWYISDHGNAHVLKFRGPSKKQIAKYHGNPAAARYGVFRWRGDNRYRKADAVAEYVHESAAQRRADKLNSTDPAGQYVVRTLAWIVNTLSARGRKAERVTRPHPREKCATNPPRGRVLIYTGGRIVGTWYGRHRNGKLYKHRFGGSSKMVYGLPDGSIQIVPSRGRLWGMH